MKDVLGGSQTAMEVFFSATMGELVSRSISFLVDRFLSRRTAPTEEDRLHDLQRILLRVQVIVEEAEERRITNTAMLHQLSILKKQMYRGYYTLDSFSCRDRMTKDLNSHSFAPSMFNPAKRVCFRRGSSQSAQAEMLEQVLGSMKDTMEDMSEFVMFLFRCPRLCRQPYSMYLLLNKCMFNRQMEMEHIINFLLQEETDPHAEKLGVLPIIGPGKVGKSTLIEHVCDDGRVRNHFSQILCFNEDDLKDGSVVMTLRHGGMIKHGSHSMDGKRTLIVIEVVQDIEEFVWKRLCSAARSRAASGSKIILASRSERIASFGTTRPLRVQFFSQEAYWYYFKVRTFGSTDADEHPKLLAIAMDMTRELNGCFMGATIFSGLLKANFNPCFWSMTLSSIRNFKQKNVLLHGARFADPWQVSEPVYLSRVNETSSEYFVILDDYETRSAQAGPEAPQMTLEDLLFGSARPQGKFKVLGWRSHLPPHYHYVLNCEIRRPRHRVARNKRFQKISN